MRKMTEGNTFYGIIVNEEIASTKNEQSHNVKRQNFLYLQGKRKSYVRVE